MRGRVRALTRTGISLDWMRRTGEVLNTLASEGLPVPRHDLVLDLADGRLGIVQERLPGHPPRRVDRTVMDAMIAANARFADVLADRRDLPDQPCTLPGGADERHMHRDLESYSERARRLSRRIVEVGRAPQPATIDRDLVHPDFGLGNVLLDEAGSVTGVIDWNGGAARGDHRFALLKMVINVDAEGDQYGVEQEAVDRLDEVLRTTVEPDLLRSYWAGWILRIVHFCIELGYSARIDRTITLGERRLL